MNPLDGYSVTSPVYTPQARSTTTVGRQMMAEIKKRMPSGAVVYEDGDMIMLIPTEQTAPRDQ